jgi:hypothetical protein
MGISIREVEWEAAAEPKVHFRPSGRCLAWPGLSCVSKKNFSIKSRYQTAGDGIFFGQSEIRSKF